jgi:hypothetical protein
VQKLYPFRCRNERGIEKRKKKYKSKWKKNFYCQHSSVIIKQFEIHELRYKNFLSFQLAFDVVPLRTVIAKVFVEMTFPL